MAEQVVGSEVILGNLRGRWIRTALSTEHGVSQLPGTAVDRYEDSSFGGDSWSGGRDTVRLYPKRAKGWPERKQ